MSSQSETSRLEALSRVLQNTISSSARGITYTVAALGTLALIPGLNVPPELGLIAGGIGIEAMGSLLEKVASKQKISDDEILAELNNLLKEAEITDLLSKDDFFHAFSHLRKHQRSLSDQNEATLVVLKSIRENLEELEKKYPARSTHISGNTILFSGLTQVSGNVAAGNIIINENPFDNRINELVAILEDRASIILSDLSNYFKYVNVEDYAERFEKLHKKHVSALRQGNLSHAHEVLRQIHELSTKMEEDEFWESHRIHSPRRDYSLRRDAFERGIIVTGYMAGVLARYSDSYSENIFSTRNHPISSYHPAILTELFERAHLDNPDIEERIKLVKDFIRGKSYQIERARLNNLDIEERIKLVKDFKDFIRGRSFQIVRARIDIEEWRKLRTDFNDFIRGGSDQVDQEISIEEIHYNLILSSIT